MPDASPEARVRIVSWNIHGSIGRDGRCDPERIVRAVEAMGADIVALQEVDGRTHLGRQANAFETFARLLGGHRVEARLIGKPGHEHGNLLWSHSPIENGTVHLLPGGLEQRGVIEGRIRAPGGKKLSVFATHLGLSPMTRRKQADAIAKRMRNKHPAVLVGDLNEWVWSGPVHCALLQNLPIAHRPRTFPARWPIAALDRLYASGDVRVVPVEAPREALKASDHLPLIADLEF